MIAVTTSNQHGQVPIPAHMRKKFRLFPRKQVKLSPMGKGILIEPVEEEPPVINFKREKKRLPLPSFSNGEKTNWAGEVDDILYR